MTFEQFQEQVDRLKATFDPPKGRTNYAPERVAQLYAKLRSFSAETLEQAIDNLIADCAQPPLLTKLAEACWLVAQEKHEKPRFGQLPNADVPNCRGCGDMGVIQAYKRDSSPSAATFSFACKCPVGLRLPKMPRWRDELRHEFEALVFFGSKPRVPRHQRPSGPSPMAAQMAKILEAGPDALVRSLSDAQAKYETKIDWED